MIKHYWSLLMCKPKRAWCKSKFQLIMQIKIKYGFVVQIAWIDGSILREELKSSRQKHRAWISVHRGNSPLARETLYTHDILHWVEQIFVMQKRVHTIWMQRICIRKLQLGFICKVIFFYSAKSVKVKVFKNQRVHSPGFCPAFSRSSSSNAASTADFAKAPARVVEGLSKSILWKDTKEKCQEMEESVEMEGKETTNRRDCIIGISDVTSNLKPWLLNFFTKQLPRGSPFQNVVNTDIFMNFFFVF